MVDVRYLSGRTLPAALLAGAITGGADSLVTLSTNPDPANLSYRVGYALGPVFLAIVVALPLGLLASAVADRRGMTGSRANKASVAVVVSFWFLSVLIEIWRSGQTVTAQVILALAIALSALALASLALNATAALESFSSKWRYRLWASSALLLLATQIAISPGGLAAFRGGTGPCPAADTPQPASPNVLLISIDALRADVAREEMASYRRLAASGVEFTRHFTLSPWTLPSVASLLSGLTPNRHGAGRSLSSRPLLAKTPLRSGTPTISEVLGKAGYRTHAIVTNPFLTASYGIDQGFCSFENVTMEGETARSLSHTALLRFVGFLAPGLLPSDRANVVRHRAERWLSANRDRPFFLWLHFLDPHAPYGDRDGESTSLALDLMAFQSERGLGVPFRALGLLRAGEYRPTPDERRQIVGLYREDVRFVDGEIGHLLDFLAAHGLRERTAVLLTADHGEEFWEHGGVEHGRTLYDEILRVPLVLSFPRATSQLEPRDDLTSVIDLAPTISHLAGIPPQGWIGVDLIAERAGPDRTLDLGNLLFGEEWTGMRTATFKYMRSEHGEERLFELRRDPGERVNEVAAIPQVLAMFRAQHTLESEDP